MGFYLTEQTTNPAAENRPATHRPRPGAKTPIGAPFWNPILSSKYWDPDTKLAYYGYRYYSPTFERFLSRDPIMEHSFFFMSTAGMEEKDRDELWLAVLGHEFGFTQNDPLNRIDPLGLKDRLWPFNGRIKVDSNCKNKNIQGVDIDNRKVYNPQPGESTPWNDDVDFVQCDGKWYKIGAANFKVKPDDKECCKCPDGFREATPDERKAIDDIIKNPGKK